MSRLNNFFNSTYRKKRRRKESIKNAILNPDNPDLFKRKERNGKLHKTDDKRCSNT